MIEDYFESGYEVKRPTAINSGGIAKSTFQTVATIRGRMRPLSGREIYQNEKLNYTTTHRFYCSVIGIQVDDLISKDGKLYEVKLIVNPMNMNEHLQIDCQLKEL